MKKTVLLIPLLLVMAGIVYGESTFIYPVSGDTVIGTDGWNVTTTTFVNTTNCTITGTSASTGDTAAIVLLGTAAGSVNASAAIDSTAYSDTNDWTFSGNCYLNNSANTSCTSAITAITGVIVDNSNPVCTDATTYVSDSTISPKATFTMTAQNATSGRLYYAGKTYDLDKTAYAITGNSGSRTMSYIADGIAHPILFEGTQEKIYWTITDETDTTTCDTIYNIKIEDATAPNVGGIAIAAFAADEENAKKQAEAEAQQQQEQQASNSGLQGKRFGLPIWAIIVIVLGGLYWYNKNKK